MRLMLDEGTDPRGPRNARFRTLLAVRVKLMTVAIMSWACGPGSEPSDDGLTRLRVVTQPYLVYAPLAVAWNEGYFSEQGLEVELVPMTGSERALPLLVSGRVDVLPANPAPGFFNAIIREQPIRIVSEVNRAGTAGCSPISMLARPGLLEGTPTGAVPTVRRISVSKQAVMRYLAEHALAHVGVEMDSIQLVDIPPAVRPDALASGAIDAILAGEPFLTRTLETRKAARWVGVHEALPGTQFSFIFFGRRLLEQDRDAGERFLAAYLRALRELGEGKTPENISLVARATGEDVALLSRMCWPFDRTDGRINVESVLHFQEWAVEQRLLDEVVSAEDFWDPSFIDRAHRLLAGPGDESEELDR